MERLHKGTYYKPFSWRDYERDKRELAKRERENQESRTGAAIGFLVLVALTLAIMASCTQAPRSYSDISVEARTGVAVWDTTIAP